MTDRRTDGHCHFSGSCRSQNLIPNFSWSADLVLTCRRTWRGWRDQAAGLPPPPARGHVTCWASVTMRHVAEMAASGTCVLATVAVFTTMQGLVLVLIYITFLLGTFVDVICKFTVCQNESISFWVLAISNLIFFQPPIQNSFCFQNRVQVSSMSWDFCWRHYSSGTSTIISWTPLSLTLS